MLAVPGEEVAERFPCLIHVDGIGYIGFFFFRRGIFLFGYLTWKMDLTELGHRNKQGNGREVALPEVI